jgi:hypothetical protein
LGDSSSSGKVSGAQRARVDAKVGYKGGILREDKVSLSLGLGDNTVLNLNGVTNSILECLENLLYVKKTRKNAGKRENLRKHALATYLRDPVACFVNARAANNSSSLGCVGRSRDGVLALDEHEARSDEQQCSNEAHVL